MTNIANVNLLLVDDEEEFITTLAERLGIRGIRCRTAFNGEDALKAVEADVPQVMILDVMMPGMRGLEVLERVKKSHPQIQVILLTGQGSTQDGIEGMRQGAFDYMIKPLNLDTLLNKISEAMAAQGNKG